MRPLLGKIKLNLKRILKVLWYSPVWFKAYRIAKDNPLRRFNRSGNIAPCPVCGSFSSRRIKSYYITPRFFAMYDTRDIVELYGGTGYVADGIRFFAQAFYRLDWFLCQDCKNGFQNYPHSEQTLFRYYDRFMENKPISKIRETIRKPKTLVAKYFLEKTNLKKPSKILDAGAAIGLACEYFQKQGHKAWGIEPSFERVRFAREQLKLENFNHGFYVPSSFKESYFDGIISHHVLEHVLNPRLFFEALKKHIRPGGWILLQLPCLEEDRTATGQCNHLVAYTVPGVRKLLDEFEFKVEEAVVIPKDFSKVPKGWKVDDPDCRHWTVFGDLPGAMSILARSYKRESLNDGTDALKKLHATKK